VRFLDALPEAPFLTAITAAELRLGVTVLSRGKRRRDLSDDVERFLTSINADHVLPFDAAATSHYAEVVTARRRRGRPITNLDAMIAAICRRHRAQLVTRNESDFEHTGIEVSNPWPLVR
jgi:toxin FitB